MLRGVSSDYYQKMVPIAPAPAKCKLDFQEKKYTYKSTGYNGAQVASIARRNARERNRVKQVNDGFSALRKKLPAAVIAALSGGSRRGSGKKLSKVDTLRMVVEYIRYMENLIEESDASQVTKFTKKQKNFTEIDEGVYGDSSPYYESYESVPSPMSDCSSGVSSARSSSFVQTYPQHTTPMEEDDLLDAITWWQQK